MRYPPQNEAHSRQVDTSKPKDKPYKLSDGGGLYLLVNPNGSRYWRLKYRIAGKRSYWRWGYILISLWRKPDRNARMQKKVLTAGGDPGQEKQEEKQAKEQAVANSFERLAMEWHSHKSTSWSEGYAEHLLMYLKKDIFPSSGKRRLRISARSKCLTSCERWNNAAFWINSRKPVRPAGRYLPMPLLPVEPSTTLYQIWLARLSRPSNSTTHTF